MDTWSSLAIHDFIKIILIGITCSLHSSVTTVSRLWLYSCVNDSTSDIEPPTTYIDNILKKSGIPTHIFWLDINKYDDECHICVLLHECHKHNNLISPAYSYIALTVLGVHMESWEAFVSHVRVLKRPRSMSSWYSMSLHDMHHHASLRWNSKQYRIVHIH